VFVSTILLSGRPLSFPASPSVIRFLLSLVGLFIGLKVLLLLCCRPLLGLLPFNRLNTLGRSSPLTLDSRRNHDSATLRFLHPNQFLFGQTSGATAAASPLGSFVAGNCRPSDRPCFVASTLVRLSSLPSTNDAAFLLTQTLLSRSAYESGFWIGLHGTLPASLNWVPCVER
jgi:hypothetical protein